MQLISKYNKEITYLLCAIDLFSKYAWVAPLKNKKGIAIVNAFQSILSSSKNQTKHGLIKVLNFITVIKKMFKRESHRNVFNKQ